MRALQLDFADRHAQSRKRLGWLAVALCLGVLGWQWTQQRALNMQAAGYEAQQADGPRLPTREAGQQSEQKQLRDVARALALPWSAMFDALERVQLQHKDVHLLAIAPNPVKGEVLLSGEARGVPALMAYAEALRVQPAFSEVVLVNQRAKADSDRETLVFSLALQWRLR